MTKIKLTSAFADFPVYNSSNRSLKKVVLDVATGGRVLGTEKKHAIVRALDNISLEITEGERVGLIGHNGSGKSTLLRMIGGIYAPTSGKCEVNGDIRSLTDISLGIDSESTGRQNIYLRAAMLGLSKGLVNLHIDDIIQFSELGEFIDMPLRTYSSGMQMRLAFAVSTFCAADILLMDEWLSVGDKDFSQKAECHLTNFVKQSKILVMASHSIEFLTNTCDRIIWLEHGKILMDNSSEKVLSAYAN